MIGSVLAAVVIVVAMALALTLWIEASSGAPLHELRAPEPTQRPIASPQPTQVRVPQLPKIGILLPAPVQGPSAAAFALSIERAIRSDAHVHQLILDGDVEKARERAHVVAEWWTAHGVPSNEGLPHDASLTPAEFVVDIILYQPTSTLRRAAVPAVDPVQKRELVATPGRD